MNKCMHCLLIYRGAPTYCPECQADTTAPEIYRARFNCIQIALHLSGMGWSEALSLEQETVRYLWQDMSLLDITQRIESQDKACYARFTTVLKNMI